MNDIIERKPGYSNEMMLADLEITWKVLNQKTLIKKEVPKDKIRRIKGTPAEYKMKYLIPKDILDRLDRSIE